MISYIFGNSTIPTTKTAIENTMATMELPKIVQVLWINDDLTLTFSKAGVSHISFHLSQEISDVIVTETKREISMFHRPFITMVETLIDNTLTKAGGVPLKR